MSYAFGLINFVLLTAGLFALLTALSIALIYPRLRSRLARLSPKKRARVLYLLCIAPVGLGLLHTALCFLPGALGTVWSSFDHCMYHTGHEHLCLVHLPGTAGTLVGWSVSLLVLACFLVPFCRYLARAWRTRRQFEQLVWSARRDDDHDAWVIDSDIPFAVALMARSRIVLSSSILERLSSTNLQVVLEHERAHVQRRDPLWRLIAALSACAHLSNTRQQLLDDLELASEQACDEAAGERLGSRVRVAQALLAVERLMHDNWQTRVGYASFGGPHIVSRVEALLAPPIRAGSRVSEWQWLAVGLVLSVAMTDPLHHAAEAMVTFISG